MKLSSKLVQLLQKDKVARRIVSEILHKGCTPDLKSFSLTQLYHLGVVEKRGKFCVFPGETLCSTIPSNSFKIEKPNQEFRSALSEIKIQNL